MVKTILTFTVLIFFFSFSNLGSTKISDNNSSIFLYSNIQSVVIKKKGFPTIGLTYALFLSEKNIFNESGKNQISLITENGTYVAKILHKESIKNKKGYLQSIGFSLLKEDLEKIMNAQRVYLNINGYILFIDQKTKDEILLALNKKSPSWERGAFSLMLPSSN